jgi:hypothetical protein
MAKYQNQKQSILGLSFKGDAAPRTIGPGEIFEANKEDIPEHYFTQGWIVDAKDIKQGDGKEVSPTADKPLNPKFDGPNPTQGSGTSDRQSTTDADAAKSGTYDRTTTGTKDNHNVDVAGTSGGTNPEHHKAKK